MTVIKFDPRKRFHDFTLQGDGVATWLLLSRDPGGYSLYVNKGTVGAWVCDHVKRLDTLNARAKDYGVRFETEEDAT